MSLKEKFANDKSDLLLRASDASGSVPRVRVCVCVCLCVWFEEVAGTRHWTGRETPVLFFLKYSRCTILNKLQEYNTVIHNC